MSTPTLSRLPENRMFFAILMSNSCHAFAAELVAQKERHAHRRRREPGPAGDEAPDALGRDRARRVARPALAGFQMSSILAVGQHRRQLGARLRLEHGAHQHVHLRHGVGRRSLDGRLPGRHRPATGQVLRAFAAANVRRVELGVAGFTLRAAGARAALNANALAVRAS